MTILITGVAGFIGSAVALHLLNENKSIIGIDNLNHYYDPTLKRDRLSRCVNHPNFKFECMDIVTRQEINNLFEKYQFDYVIHLAAQAGVRYSLENPSVYIDSNLVGFGNILEACRQYQVKHLVFASSSSVYGANQKLPFSEKDSADHPLSLYAATKRANELMAHSYAQDNLPCTGLRFFTVYGPWCRPDMALFSFARNIVLNKPIQVFNQGKMLRDFTYIDDIVTSIVKVMDKIPSQSSYYRIYNVGNNKPIQLTRYIEVLEECLNKKAQLELMPLQKGDMTNTYADVSELENLIGKLPHTSLEEGVALFARWFEHYCKESV